MQTSLQTSLPTSMPAPTPATAPGTNGLRRAALAAALMVGASLLALVATPKRYLADVEPREPLAQLMPAAFGACQTDDTIVPLPPSPELQGVLARTYDELLNRSYRDAQGRVVMVSMAYGRNQHRGMNTHRPEVCYPAQGFRIVAPPQPVTLALPGGALPAGTLPATLPNTLPNTLPVTRLSTAMGARHEPVTYWLVVGHQVTAFGYAQRAVALRHGLAGEIPDGVLVRVSSIDGDDARAWALHARFITDLLQALPPARARRLVGTV